MLYAQDPLVIYVSFLKNFDCIRDLSIYTVVSALWYSHVALVIVANGLQVFLMIAVSSCRCLSDCWVFSCPFLSNPSGSF